VKSYKQLPLNLYHIQWKFRDEVRPRFGVMRGREFLMKDAYSFDLDAESGRRAYDNMFVAYLRTFQRMGLTAVPMRAETGPIGGEMSHEFQILASTGESAVYYDAAFEEIDFASHDLDIAQLKSLYAATDDLHDPASCPVPPERLRSGRGIEVGHIFHFGTKYSLPMGANVMGPDGTEVPVEMGSYGIGVSRLVGALIEASHDENGIIWPEPVAPFKVALINLRPDDAACSEMANDLYTRLRVQHVDVLLDDREERAGTKFATMDLIGIPWQVAIGPRGVKADRLEVKERRTGQREELTPSTVVERFAA
jgi:prolyl-tRNA synthetase